MYDFLSVPQRDAQHQSSLIDVDSNSYNPALYGCVKQSKAEIEAQAEYKPRAHQITKKTLHMYNYVEQCLSSMLHLQTSKICVNDSG